MLRNKIFLGCWDEKKLGLSPINSTEHRPAPQIGTAQALHFDLLEKRNRRFLARACTAVSWTSRILFGTHTHVATRGATTGKQRGLVYTTSANEDSSTPMCPPKHPSSFSSPPRTHAPSAALASSFLSRKIT